MSEGPLADIVAEARRLTDGAQQSRVTVRLLGGLAVHEHSPASHPTLAREYKDIDLVTTKRESGRVEKLLTDGYEPDREFNALNGHRRLLFYDTGTRPATRRIRRQLRDVSQAPTDRPPRRPPDRGASRRAAA